MRWRSGRGPGTAVAVLALAGTLVGARPALGQGDLDAYCAMVANRSTDSCVTGRLVMAGLHPRIGLGLFGGSPVPGTASTLGMRLGSTPRFSLSGRLVLVPMEVPGTALAPAGDGSLRLGLSAQGTIGLFSGWSPMPTVGGVLAVDAIGRVSWLGVPQRDGASRGGFEEGSAWGASGGIRVGLLRESFTLPGVSITGSYGRTTALSYVDPAGFGVRGRIGDWNATAAATKRIGPVGVTGGVAYDRYTAELDLGYDVDANLATSLDGAVHRWSAFANVSWTFLILHGSLEAGWQGGPDPTELPETSVVSLDFDPPGWWLGSALRLSI